MQLCIACLPLLAAFTQNASGTSLGARVVHVAEGGGWVTCSIVNNLEVYGGYEPLIIMCDPWKHATYRADALIVMKLVSSANKSWRLACHGQVCCPCIERLVGIHAYAGIATWFNQLFVVRRQTWCDKNCRWDEAGSCWSDMDAITRPGGDSGELHPGTNW
jgi:hypothetical protein